MPKLEHRLISLFQFALLIIVIIIMINYIFNGYQGKKYSLEFENLYNKLEGEDSKYARQALDAADSEPEERRDSEYYYKRGVILQHNLNDIKGAKRCYEKALQLLNRKSPRNNDFLFITDRISDNARTARMPGLQRAAAFVQNNQIMMLADDGLQEAIMAGTTKPSNTSRIANQIEQSKTFKSDSQNVHDSSLSGDLLAQYRKLLEYNNEEGLNMTVEEFKPSTKDNTKYNRICNVLNVIKSNSSKTSLIGATEYDLLNSVWNRIHSKYNLENRKKLIEALEDQLNECATSDTATVCVAGRCSHVISSLALLDRDPTLGILKTKEVLRNELLNDAAKIVERYTGSKAETPAHVLKDYMNNNETNEVTTLKANMAREIQSLGEKYEGRLPVEQRDLLIQQSLAVIQ